MEKKVLKHLNRRELLQMLLMQAEENDRLNSELVEANERLKHREIVMKETGSLSEASLQLSGIFYAADEAVKYYTETIREMATRQENEYNQRMKEAQECAYTIIAEANAYSKRKHEEADAYYEEMKKKVEMMKKDDKR